MPLPSTTVIHPRWSEHHQPTATGTMTAECIITTPASTGTTAADGVYTPGAASTIYTGVCRVITLPRLQGITAVGAEQETHRRFQVSITADAPDIPIGALVGLTVATDPRLVGKKLRVTEVAYESEHWQRDLMCDEREA